MDKDNVATIFCACGCEFRCDEDGLYLDSSGQEYQSHLETCPGPPAEEA